MFAHIRKAVFAGVGGFVGTGISWLGKAALDGSVTGEDVSQAVGAGVAAALALAYGVYKTRNAGTVNGSYQRGGAHL